MRHGFFELFIGASLASICGKLSILSDKVSTPVVCASVGKRHLVGRDPFASSVAHFAFLSIQCRLVLCRLHIDDVILAGEGDKANALRFVLTVDSTSAVIRASVTRAVSMNRCDNRSVDREVGPRNDGLPAATVFI